MYTYNCSFKRLLCLLLAVITLAGVLLLPGNTLAAHAAEKTVTIPDPADYFGEVSKTEKEERYNAYTFNGYSSFPKSKVENYYNALKKLGLTTNDNATESIINFKYNGNSGVQISWSKSNADIRVNVVKPLTVGKTTTSTTSKSNTTTKSGTTTTNSGKKVTIPSPADYFGDIDKSSKAGSAIVYECEGFSTYPKSKVDSYIKALKKAGLTGGTVEKQSNGDMLAVLNHNNQRAISIRWYKKDKYVWFNISNIVSVAGTSTTQTTKPTTTTKTTTTKPSAEKMMTDIFGNSPDVKYDGLITIDVLYDYKYTSYPAGKMDKYAKQLQDLGLKEVVKYSRADETTCIEYHWNGKMVVKIWYDPDDDEFSVGFDWDELQKADIFDEKDIPKETEPIIPEGRERCFWCGGDGKCRDCGGSGYKMKWVSGTVREYVKQNCTSCYSPGKCRDCGGTGWE